MSPSLASLPAEIQLAILCSADDLDDASSFSQICRRFRSLYTTHRDTVERGVITSSLVYEYDLTLSRFLKVTRDIADIYLEGGRELALANFPKESVLSDCTNTTWTKTTATDEIIGEIVSRWRQSRLLRQLYLDDAVAAEFQHFRSQFALKLSAQSREAIVEPGLIRSSQPQQSHHFGLDFKARFHKSLCLHSMAIAHRDIAKAVMVNGPLLHPDHTDLSDPTSANVYDLWSKNSVVIGGEKRLLSLDTRLDCLEVFDFLYLFLLRKIMSRGKFKYGLMGGSGEWPYVPMSENDIHIWHVWLKQCRWILQPLDLLDLIEHQAWTAEASYPRDKSEYMRVRSVFNMGVEVDRNWYYSYERSPMVHALLPAGKQYVNRDPEDHCWWDLVRLKIGSPFQPEFRSKFLAEHKIIGKPSFVW